MDINERITLLQEDLEATRRELYELLVDIRIELLEAQSPLQMFAVSAQRTAAAEPEARKEVTINGR